MSNPFKVVDDFEDALCEYTGASFACTTASCTDALGICFEYLRDKQPYDLPNLFLPKKTYIGVACQAKRTGYEIIFEDIDWFGEYRIDPLDVWDCAKRFTKNMFHDEYGPHDDTIRYKCVSFHGSKILGFSHGGAILHNDQKLAKYSNELRFDGRNFKELQPKYAGRHANMTPDVAAALLYKLHHLPDNNPDLPNSDYPDLSKMDIFK